NVRWYDKDSDAVIFNVAHGRFQHQQVRKTFPLFECRCKTFNRQRIVAYWQVADRNVRFVQLRRLDNIMRVYIHRYFRSEEHTSELQSRFDLVCRLLLEKKKQKTTK